MWYVSVLSYAPYDLARVNKHFLRFAALECNNERSQEVLPQTGTSNAIDINVRTSCMYPVSVDVAGVTVLLAAVECNKASFKEALSGVTPPMLLTPVFYHLSTFDVAGVTVL